MSGVAGPTATLSMDLKIKCMHLNIHRHVAVDAQYCKMCACFYPVKAGS